MKKTPEITVALNGKDVLMLLSTVSRKSWVCQVLLFIFSWNTSPIGKKSPDREFYWSVSHEFHSWLGIWNYKLVRFAYKFVWKSMLLRQNNNNNNSNEKIEKKYFTFIALFSEEWKSSQKKESLHDEGSVSSYQMPPCISCKGT